MALTGLLKLANAIERFQPEKEIESIIRSNAGGLEDLQREQLAAGEDATGKPYTFKGRLMYSPFTIRYKQKFGFGYGRITDHFTLYQTGALYEKLKLQVKGSTFAFNSSVPYFNEVVQSVGDKVIGLNEDSRQRFYKRVLLPAFAKEFQKETGVKLTIR